MKKFFILSVLLITCSDIFAFATQGHWRWRKDDGSETTATWLANTDVQATISSSVANVRVRFQLYFNGSGTTDLNTSVLTYSGDNGVTWDSVSTNNNGQRAFILAGTSSFVNNLDPTTRQISGIKNNNFEVGEMITSSNTLGLHTLAKSDTTEYEWVIKPTEKVLPNTTYLFRVDTKPGDKTYGTGSAKLRTASVLPITLADFKVQQVNGRVQLQWTTATELNSDHFEIERSTNGNKWEKIATVKAAGNSNQSRIYKVYDDNAVNGTSYYRIRQYDFDGSYHFSETRSLKIILENKVFAVFPNPATTAINLIIKNYAGSQVTATLSTIGGKIVHQELISIDKSATNYKLNIKTQPVAGTYVLLLTGDNLSQSIKVIVQ